MAQYTLRTLFLITITLAGTPLLSMAETWQEHLSTIKQEGLKEGISQQTLNRAFDHLKAPSRVVKSQSTHQPEQTISYTHYIHSRADKERIQTGIKKFKQYQITLEKIQKIYGVSDCVVTAVWGLESYYGEFQGQFPVIQSLATLSYHSERKAFYNRELLVALKMVDEKQIALSQFKGAWAGASGQCQFMPSSWQAYAVDFDGDGKKNIWTNTPDALASTANFLKKNGWRTHQPIMIPVKLPEHFNQNLMNNTDTKSVSEWKKLGVIVLHPDGINDNLPAYIALPDGGPPLMVFTNFTVLKRWNNSIYFAGAVNAIAKGICNTTH